MDKEVAVVVEGKPVGHKEVVETTEVVDVAGRIHSGSWAAARKKTRRAEDNQIAKEVVVHKLEVAAVHREAASPYSGPDRVAAVVAHKKFVDHKAVATSH